VTILAETKAMTGMIGQLVEWFAPAYEMEQADLDQLVMAISNGLS